MNVGSVALDAFDIDGGPLGEDSLNDAVVGWIIFVVVGDRRTIAALVLVGAGGQHRNDDQRRVTILLTVVDVVADVERRAIVGSVENLLTWHRTTTRGQGPVREAAGGLPHASASSFTSCLSSAACTRAAALWGTTSTSTD